MPLASVKEAFGRIKGLVISRSSSTSATHTTQAAGQALGAVDSCGTNNGSGSSLGACPAAAEPDVVKLAGCPLNSYPGQLKDNGVCVMCGNW